MGMLLTELTGITRKVEEHVPGALELFARIIQILTKMILNSWEKVGPGVP